MSLSLRTSAIFQVMMQRNFFCRIVEVAKATNAVGNDYYARELFGKAIRK